ncbi:EF_hand domain-containing protein [Hexamita inflata]|uniref:EF hand domain-containing protein n=1 Tax=Hexamita inflata TaxID=28002 RepID=A0AA86PGY6_9EUKA|nr:EF hand domain-containing protein [Hexamita inflata]
MGCAPESPQTSNKNESSQLPVKFTVPDKQIVQEAFNNLDKDNNQKIDQNEILELMKTLNKPITIETLKRAFKFSDQNDDALLNQEEFFHLYYVLLNSEEDSNLMAFLFFDDNCSGTIDSKELGKLARKLGHSVEEAQIQKLHKNIADNDDETISFELFKLILEQLIGQ